MFFSLSSLHLMLHKLLKFKNKYFQKNQKFHRFLNIDFIIACPFPHNLDNRLSLWGACVSQKQQNLSKGFSWLVACHYKLKRSSTGSTLAFPVLGIGVHSLHQIKGTCRIIKVTHLEIKSKIEFNEAQSSKIKNSVEIICLF